MDPETICTINGVSLIEYELGKFKIIKEPPFFDLSDSDPSFGVYDKYHTIGSIAVALYNELDKRHSLEISYNSGREPPDNTDLPSIFMEIINNAELHGNKYDPNKATWIEYTFEEYKEHANFIMTVKDESKGFDYDLLKAAFEQDKGTKLSYNNYRQDELADNGSGHGIFGTLRYCDMVTWNDKGNEITILKKLKLQLQI